MDPLKTIPEAAEMTRLPVATLRYMRHCGTGPKSAKVGRRVVYRESDLIAWIDAAFAKDERAGEESVPPDESALLRVDAYAAMLAPERSGWDECWSCLTCRIVGRGLYAHTCTAYALALANGTPLPVVEPPPAPVVNDDPDDDRPEFLRRFFPLRRTPKVTATPGTPVSPQLLPARLDGILAKLSNTPEGGRNAMLYWSACRFGEMLAAGELSDPRAAADTLAQVAVDIGLTPSETIGSIASGFRNSGVTV